jgi:hypothetical protein
VLEQHLFERLQKEVLKPEVIDYAVEQFGKKLVQSMATMSQTLGRMRDRKHELEAELGRLTAAVAASGHSAFLLTAITDRERELRDITETLLAERGESIESRLKDIRQFVTDRLGDLRKLLNADVQRARAELAKHVTDIRLVPVQAASQSHYIAEGTWDLVGGYEGGSNREGKRVGLVAGGGFEPPTFGL